MTSRSGAKWQADFFPQQPPAPPPGECPEFVTGDFYKRPTWDRLTRKKCGQALESVRDDQPALRDPDSEFRFASDAGKDGQARWVGGRAK